MKPNPVAPARPGGSPFGNRPQPNASAQPAEKTEDTKTGNGQGDKVAASKPATPIGSRSSFGQPSAQPAPFGSKPAEQSAPAAKSSEKVDDSDNDLDDEKVAEAKPATPIGNRNPFGQPSAQLASAAKPVEKADEDSDDDLDDDKVAEAKPATPIGNRPNPFGSRPGGNPFGSKPASPAKDEDDDLDENDAADARPAASSRPNPFGSAPNAAPKPGGSPFGARPPVGQTASTAKPADEDDDLDAENDEPATPIGNRPNPFGARPGGSPFGTKPPQSGVERLMKSQQVPNLPRRVALIHLAPRRMQPRSRAVIHSVQDHRWDR